MTSKPGESSEPGNVSHTPHRRRFVRTALVFAVMLTLGLTGLVFAVSRGPVPIPIADVVSVLAAGPSSAEGDDPSARIIWSLRLPRALTAALVGAMLAVAGVLLQGVMRNPLAAPNVVGLNAGAGLAATIVLAAFPLASAWLPPAAMAGAIIATFVVYAISWEPGTGTSPVRMVLAGVAMTTMLGAVTTTLMLTTDRAAQAVIGWMAGSLEGTSWPAVRTLAPWCLGGAVLSAVLIRGLDALQLGDEGARSIGAHAERTRLGAITAAAVLAGAAVSVAGLVGFVGLIVPHIARMLVGWRHAAALPVAAVGGATLVIWADLAAREVFAPQQLPVGVVTSLIGGPYFLFLLYRVKALR
ncbi:MAG: iron ABC transporter permease [Planctomycetota bacterium]